MKINLKLDIEKILNEVHIDSNILKEFQKRVVRRNLVREKNSLDHFCVMIVPFNKKSDKVYLGHHKKADDWIPPGGHIEKDEMPIETAIREAKEELGISITENQLKLFTLDYLDVSGPNKICKMHWHIWYLFETEEVNYKFDSVEFYDAKWFTIADATKVITIPQYRETILKLE